MSIASSQARRKNVALVCSQANPTHDVMTAAAEYPAGAVGQPRLDSSDVDLLIRTTAT